MAQETGFVEEKFAKDRGGFGANWFADSGYFGGTMAGVSTLVCLSRIRDELRCVRKPHMQIPPGSHRHGQ